jgi:hypothetical protein
VLKFGESQKQKKKKKDAEKKKKKKKKSEKIVIKPSISSSPSSLKLVSHEPTFSSSSDLITAPSAFVSDVYFDEEEERSYYPVITSSPVQVSTWEVAEAERKEQDEKRDRRARFT